MGGKDKESKREGSPAENVGKWKKIRYTPSKEIVERWKREIGEEETDDWYLNEDKIIGIPKKLHTFRTFLFGEVRFKLLPPRGSPVRVTEEVSVNGSVLRKVLHFLRVRKRKVTLGITEKAGFSCLVASRKGEYVVMAPLLNPHSPIDLVELLEEMPEPYALLRLMEKLKGGER